MERVDLNQANAKIDDAKIVAVFAISIFLPYILSTFALIIIAIYIIVKPNTRKFLMIFPGTKILYIFFAYGLVITALSTNWIGLFAGIGILLAFVLGVYLRSIMTDILYEDIIAKICYYSVISTIWAIIEMYLVPLFNNKNKTNRASAMFFYPNYFGTIISIVIILCAYKVITSQGNKWVYYGIAIFDVISLYLCKSMFAWVSIFFGVAVLLIQQKRHRILAGWLFFATVAGFIVLFLNIDIIPRLNEAEVTTQMRIDIWTFARLKILESPLIGHGFMAYLFEDKSMHLGYLVPHSHSIIIELILCFGVIGTLLFLVYFYYYFLELLKLRNTHKNIYTCIVAILSASLIHGLVDLTLMWVQTLPLFLFLLSGVGVNNENNKLKNTIKALK